MLWKFTDFLKLREEAVPARVLGEWRYGANDEGVSLSMWLHGAPLQVEQWPEYQPTTSLLALWQHEQVTSSAVRFSHDTVADMPDYDATRLGLPRYIDADMWITLDGRPESPHLSVRTEFLPYGHHRALENIAFNHAFLQHKGQQYRLRTEQYHALIACRSLQQKPDFDALLDAYMHLYHVRHQSRNTGVRIEGYVPRLQLEECRYFNLVATGQGVMVAPHVPYEAYEPVALNHTHFKPWSALWQSGEDLPNAWLLPQHRYLRLGEAWLAALHALRPQLRGMHDVEAAKQWIQSELPHEMRFSVR